MGSVYQVGDKWRASVMVKGVRKTKLLRTRREAHTWAAAAEHSLGQSPQHGKTLDDLLDRYCAEVVPGKRGARWEAIRIAMIRRRFPGICSVPLESLKPQHIADFRESRGKTVSASTVRREMAIIGAALEHARREWQWIAVNPSRDVRKPSEAKHRERTLHWREIKAMLRSGGYGSRTVTGAVSGAMLLAIRTGMRAGEICAIEWSDVHPDYIQLHTSKTGDGRNVPLSRQARRVVEGFRGWDSQSLVGLKPQTLDAVFRKIRVRAGLEGFTFHDTRHTAATMLARKVDALTLCKIFGWRSTTRALTYYNPTASEIAKRL